jgi:hypothetical protein
MTIQHGGNHKTATPFYPTFERNTMPLESESSNKPGSSFSRNCRRFLGSRLKTLFLTIIILSSSASLAHGQAALLVLIFGEKAASENFYFSIKLGGNISSLSSIDNSSIQHGLNFGLTATIKLSDKWYLVPEFSAISAKGATDIPLRSSGNASLDTLLQTAADRTRELNYIDIPVLAKYQFHESISVGAGPQLSILTGATDKFLAAMPGDAEVSYNDDIKSQLNSVDFGLVVELVYSLSDARKGKGVNIHARYTYGLTDIVKDNPGDALRNSVFQICASFPFVKIEEEEKSDK